MNSSIYSTLLSSSPLVFRKCAREIAAAQTVWNNELICWIVSTISVWLPGWIDGVDFRVWYAWPKLEAYIYRKVHWVWRMGMGLAEKITILPQGPMKKRKDCVFWLEKESPTLTAYSLLRVLASITWAAQPPLRAEKTWLWHTNNILIGCMEIKITYLNKWNTKKYKLYIIHFLL